MQQTIADFLDTDPRDDKTALIENDGKTELDEDRLNQIDRGKRLAGIFATESVSKYV